MDPARSRSKFRHASAPACTGEGAAEMGAQGGASARSAGAAWSAPNASRSASWTGAASPAGLRLHRASPAFARLCAHPSNIALPTTIRPPAETRRNPPFLPIALISPSSRPIGPAATSSRTWSTSIAPAEPAETPKVSPGRAPWTVLQACSALPRPLSAPFPPARIFASRRNPSSAPPKPAVVLTWYCFGTPVVPSNRRNLRKMEAVPAVPAFPLAYMCACTHAQAHT